MEQKFDKEYTLPGWNTADKEFYPYVKPLRFKNEEIEYNIENVLKIIKSNIEKRK